MSTTPRGITTPERGQADKVRARLATEIERIRGQRNLSEPGRRARLADAVVRAQEELQRLRTAEADRVTGRHDQIIHKLFGQVRPDDSRVISIRDATDRASQIKTPDEAAQLMNRAELHGDTVLLTALARECAQRRSPLDPAWSNLFTTWAAQQPGGNEALHELSIIGDETTDAGHRLLRERAFSIGSLPREIAGAGDLRTLAAQADTIPELPPSAAEQVGKRLAGMIRAEIE